MKKTLITMAALLLASLVSAQEGEIIYTDFEPDLYKNFHSGAVDLYEPLFFDIDQDGINDMMFRAVYGYYHDIKAELLLDDWDDPEIPNYRWWRVPYENYGDTVSTPLPTHLPVIYSEVGFYHEFVAIRYQPDLNEENYYWGWIEVTVNATETDEWGLGPYNIDLTIHQMAFCTIPNYPFRVGQTSLDWGVEEAESTAFATIHPNPANNIVTVTGKSLKSAEVFNMLGQPVAKVKSEGETLRIDITNLPSGVYFVNVMDEEGRKCVKKVVKE